MAISTTYIQLIGEYANRGINEILELETDIVVPINFAISDIRDVTKKTGSFSKSIKVPGTKNNNKVLNYLFNVNVPINSTTETTFNVNRKQSCIIVQDGSVILDNAVMQLVSVDKVSKGMGYDEKIYYTIVIKDTVSDLFSTIGTSILRDLDFSEFNEGSYKAENIITTFGHTASAGYKYILPYSVYPEYKLTELKPGFYVKTYFDKIFASAGYSYEWPSTSYNIFEKLIVPYSGGPVLSDPNEVRVNVTNGGSAQNITANDYQILPATPTLIDTPIELYDPGYFNNTTMVYTNPFTLTPPGNLIVRVEIDWELSLYNPNVEAIFCFNIPTEVQWQPRIYILGNIVSTATTIGVESVPLYANDVSYQAGNWVDTSSNPGALSFNITNQYAPGATVTVSSGKQTIDIPINLLVGDSIQIKAFTRTSMGNVAGIDQVWINVISNTVATDPTSILKINNINVTIIPSDDSFAYNFPVEMNTYLPKAKQSEFLKSIFTMFNMYVFPDKTDTNLIKMYHRDEYYDDGEVKDWSLKLDKSSNNTVTFLPDITCKKLKLSYKEDRDNEFNLIYQQQIGEVYGQIEYTFDSEYVKNSQTNELLFAPSPIVKTPFGAYVYSSNGLDPKDNLHVLYDYGPTACSTYSIINFGTGGATPGATSAAGTYIVQNNLYPMCTHFDVIPNPQFDLNFAICDYYFTDTLGILTANNLANTYWRRTISQINNSILYTVYLNLTSKDIQDFKLNDKIYLDSQYWNVNKIIDYDANSDNLTKVELLKVDDSLVVYAYNSTPPSDAQQQAGNQGGGIA